MTALAVLIRLSLIELAEGATLLEVASLGLCTSIGILVNIVLGRDAQLGFI